MIKVLTKHIMTLHCFFSLCYFNNMIFHIVLLVFLFYKVQYNVKIPWSINMVLIKYMLYILMFHVIIRNHHWS